jgi:hypothetical protein
MIRTVITPDNATVTFAIPESYVGHMLEIITTVVDEPNETILYTKKRKKTFSSFSLDINGFKFNRDEANER